MKIKKIIAVLLTLIMVTAMLPTAFAEGETSSVSYVFKNKRNSGPSDVGETIHSPDGTKYVTDYTTERNWAYLGYTGSALNGSAYLKIRTYLEGLTYTTGMWAAFKIRVPEAGLYAVSASAYMHAKTTQNMEIYLVPMNAVLDDQNAKTAKQVFEPANNDVYGTIDATTGTCTGYTSVDASGKFGSYDLSPYLVAKTDICTTTNGKAEGLATCDLDYSKDVKVTNDMEEYVLLFVTQGTRSNGYNRIYPESLTLTEVEEDISAPTHVTLATSTSIAPDTINIVGDKYTRGTEVTASAEPELTVGEKTYVFRHWVRGTADKGEVVSKSPSYSFPLMTNTYLTAVYSEKTDDKIVEFYNGNGDYLETKTVVNNAVELPETPALTGFKFLQWIVGKNGNESIVLDKDNVTADVTYAVAEFGDNETVKFTVAGESEKVVYDTSITRNSSDGEEKTWYRNGALVGYGTSYTFNVWADVTSIEEKAITAKAPVVYLDPVAKDSARMIEYDAGGKEIAEVGILFGDGTDMTVESCKYKATSQENGGEDGHGQFTAKPANDSYKNAKGYLIYKDGDTYKVVYSD